MRFTHTVGNRSPTKTTTRSSKGLWDEDERSGNTEAVVQDCEDESGEEPSGSSSVHDGSSSGESLGEPSSNDRISVINSIVVDDMPPKPRNRKSVSFGALHVREFSVAMGDNPSVQFGGPPIRLDYDQGDQEYSIISVDDYESSRGDRRSVAELRVPAVLRRKWAGRDPSLERQIFRTQCQRRRTAAAKIEHDKWYYTLEKAKRGLVKKLQFNKEPKSQADLWCQQYREKRSSIVSKEPTKSKLQMLSCWQPSRATHNATGRKKKSARVQDISMFFV